MLSQKKPLSAITVSVENLTSESFDIEDLSGIPDLVEVIKLQATGPTEAARAIRKKLKYGNTHRQLRALVLEGLIQNAGSNFQRTFADEPLLERLRFCARDKFSDQAVRKKCADLFREWSQYTSTAGLEKIARLHKELPRKKVAVTQDRSKVIRETDNPFGDNEEAEAERTSQQLVRGSGTSHATAQPREKKSLWDKDKNNDKSKDKSAATKIKPFNLEAEKEKMKSVISESIASTDLTNALRSINREQERISDNKLAVQHFEACKQLRKRLLRYIHLVESEQWLGSLLHANDELVHALMAFEQLDQSIDADSDSEDELARQAHMYRMAAGKAREDDGPTVTHEPHIPDLAGLTLQSTPIAKRPAPIPASSVTAPASASRPSRPTPVAASGSYGGNRDDDGDDDGEDESDEDGDDENNPFGDRNALTEPTVR